MTTGTTSLKISVNDDGVPVLEEALWPAQIKQESGGNPKARSPKGAMGLMQLMPGTYSDWQKKLGLGSDPYNVKDNLTAGKAHMRMLLQRYGGNLDYALAAYNWGHGNVDKWIKRGADPSRLPKETQGYISNIRSTIGLGGSPFTARPSHVQSAGPEMPPPGDATGRFAPGVSEIFGELAKAPARMRAEQNIEANAASSLPRNAGLSQDQLRMLIAITSGQGLSSEALEQVGGL